MQLCYAGRVSKYEAESERASRFAVQYCCATAEQTAFAGHRQRRRSAYCVNAPTDILVIADVFLFNHAVCFNYKCR